MFPVRGKFVPTGAENTRLLSTDVEFCTETDSPPRWAVVAFNISTGQAEIQQVLHLPTQGGTSHVAAATCHITVQMGCQFAGRFDLRKVLVLVFEGLNDFGSKYQKDGLLPCWVLR